MNRNWKRWEKGWGETLELAPGLKLSVYRGMLKGDLFSFTVFGLNSKRQYETMDEAKENAKELARLLLEKASEALTNDQMS